MSESTEHLEPINDNVSPVKKKRSFFKKLTQTVFSCQCLASDYGDFPIYQEAYVCSSCLKNEIICSYCYTHCHKNCKKLENPFLYGATYVCACAQKLKHIPRENNNQQEEVKQERNLDKGELLEIVLKEPSNINIYTNFPNILLNLKITSIKSFSLIDGMNREKSFPVTYTTLGYSSSEFERYLDHQSLIHFLEYALSLPQNEVKVDLLHSLNPICAIFSAFHLKKDFKNIKCLIPINFLKFSIVELFNFKRKMKKLFKKTTNIYKKYSKLSDIYKMIEYYSRCIVLLIKHKKITLSIMTDFIDFVCFICQYMLPNFKNITYIVKAYSDMIEQLMNSLDTFMVPSLVFNFTDSCFMLAKIYNVLVLEKYHKKGRTKRNNIFYKNETGQTMFILLMQFYDFIRSHRDTNEVVDYIDNSLFIQNISQLYAFPFGGLVRQPNVDYDFKKIPNVEIPLEIMDKIAFVLNLVQFNSINRKEAFTQLKSLCTEFKRYIAGKIKLSLEITYRSIKHMKVVKQIKEFYNIKDQNAYIANFKDLIYEMIVSNVDSHLSRILVVLYQRGIEDEEELKSFVEERDLELLKLITNILSMFLLSMEGINAFALGEPMHFLKLIQRMCFDKNDVLFEDYKIISGFLNLFPKRVIQEKIKEKKIALYKEKNRNKEMDYLILEHISKTGKSNSFCLNFFQSIFLDFNDFINNEFSQQKFFDIIIHQKIKELEQDEKIKFKLCFKYLEVLTKHTINYKQDFWNYCKSVFIFLDNPDLYTIFKKELLSCTKRKILIKTMTLFWFCPIYNKHGGLLRPLTNEELAAYQRLYTNEKEPKAIEEKEMNFQRKVVTQAKELDEESRKKISLKLRHIGNIIKLMKVLKHELKKTTNVYNKNDKDYFLQRKLLKEVIRSIAVITTYFFNYENITNKILPQYLKLINTFLNKEFYLLKFFDLEADESTMNKLDDASFDYCNKAAALQIMLREITKFSPVIQNSKFNSVYRLYLNNNSNSFFSFSYTPFTFLSEPQNKNNELIHDESKYELVEQLGIKNFKEYSEYVKSQIKDEENYVLFNVMNDNPKLNKYIRVMGTHLFFEDFLQNYLLDYTNILNFLYKICSYNVKWMIKEFKKESNEVKLTFFRKMKQWMMYFLLTESNLSKCFANLAIETQIGYITVSLLQLLELFGEGYNFSYHSFILQDRSEVQHFDFERITDEKIKKAGKGKETENSAETEENELLQGKMQKNEDDLPDEEKTNLKNKKTLTMFEVVVLMLDRNINDIIKHDNYNFINNFDNNILIVILAQIEFLIEFFYTLNQTHEALIDNAMMWLIKHNLIPTENGLSIFNILVNKPTVLKENILFLKGKLLDLLNSYISSGDKTELVEYLQKSDIAKFSTVNYFKQILFYFDSLLEDCLKKNKSLKEKIEALNKITNEDEYVNKLIEINIWESKFRGGWQLKLMFKLYRFIQILESNYNVNDITKYIKDLQQSESKRERWNYPLYKTIGLYNFLKRICIPIELNYVVSEQEKENLVLKEEENEELVEERILTKEDETGVIKSFKKIKKRNILEGQTNEDAIKQKYGTTFFTVPYFSFYLSNQSKVRFEENVDRSSKTTKAKSLINAVESFLFEMIVNQYVFNSPFSMMVSKINYFYFEIFNFFLVCLHNIILIIHYYRSWTLDDATYELSSQDEFNELLKNNNWILAIVQICFLVCVIGLWYKFNFIQCYFNNLQLQYENKSPLFERVKKYRELFNSKKPDFYKVLNEQFVDVPFTTKLRVAIIDSFLLNGEISIPILTLLCLIAYLIFHSPLFLVIPVLFLAHIFSTLSAVFQGVYSRFGHLFAVYMFTYLVIYIFMWTGFLFFGNLFKVDTINSNNDPVATEPFCSSSVQCILFFINYGIRSGGGIGDLLGTPSFKDNYAFFLKIFVYEIFFHLCIVMIFANVFLGLIADAFGELREVAWMKENDKNNICFICQIDSDTCAIKGIDFEEHVQNKHQIWNYVYFLSYLYMKDESQYNIMEYKIMSSINELNLSWIPFAGNNDDD